MATSGLCYSFKQELLQAGHCFNATLSSLAGAGVNGQFTITGLATTLGIALGVAAGGTNVAAGAIVASVDSASQVTVSKAHTGTVTTGTISFTADALKIALVKASPVTTFGPSQTNIGTPGSSASSTTNLGTDEVSGTGYTTGGFALTNVTPSVPATPGTVGTTSFSPNPSWTTATFSTTAAIIYNNTTRLGAGATPLNGRTVGIYDFGGTQTVSSGTFTLVMPVNDGNNAVIRLS